VCGYYLFTPQGKSYVNVVVTVITCSNILHSSYSLRQFNLYSHPGQMLNDVLDCQLFSTFQFDMLFCWMIV